MGAYECCRSFARSPLRDCRMPNSRVRSKQPAVSSAEMSLLRVLRCSRCNCWAQDTYHTRNEEDFGGEWDAEADSEGGERVFEPRCEAEAVALRQRF